VSRFENQFLRTQFKISRHRSFSDDMLSRGSTNSPSCLPDFSEHAKNSSIKGKLYILPDRRRSCTSLDPAEV